MSVTFSRNDFDIVKTNETDFSILNHASPKNEDDEISAEEYLSQINEIKIYYNTLIESYLQGEIQKNKLQTYYLPYYQQPLEKCLSNDHIEDDPEEETHERLYKIKDTLTSELKKLSKKTQRSRTSIDLEDSIILLT